MSGRRLAPNREDAEQLWWHSRMSTVFRVPGVGDYLPGLVNDCAREPQQGSRTADERALRSTVLLDAF